MLDIYDRIRKGSPNQLLINCDQIDYAILFDGMDFDYLQTINFMLRNTTKSSLFQKTNINKLVDNILILYNERYENYTFSTFFDLLSQRLNDFSVKNIFDLLIDKFREDTFNLNDLHLFMDYSKNLRKRNIDSTFSEVMFYKALNDNIVNIKNSTFFSVLVTCGLFKYRNIFEQITRYSNDELKILINLIYYDITGRYIENNTEHLFNFYKELNLTIDQLFAILIDKNEQLSISEINFIT